MEKQYQYFHQLIQATSLENMRPLIRFLDKPNRMAGIKGARGVGKTTLLLQYAKQSLPLDRQAPLLKHSFYRILRRDPDLVTLIRYFCQSHTYISK